ncbi:uncharacterized protein [Phaseolus vulgaris]|uniref:uncharacterized protein n=1 Tax=Phaseolus vulgaris TaxID=3885 RepID=UPI0035CC0F39
MAVEAPEPDQSPEPDFFTKADLQDVVPHDNDPVVISVVREKGTRSPYIDQGSSTDVMFCSTFNKLQLSPDQLRPYDDCLYGFAGDQVEVRGHVELRTTFTDGTTSRTVNIRYLVVNAPSAYNILLGRPSLEGAIITIKSDQKATKKCYENSLKTKRGVCSITSQPQEGEGVTRAKMARERRPEPTGEVLEREIGGKKFKLGKSLSQEIQDQIAEVIAWHLDAFARSALDMPDIDPDFLCHCLMMDPKVRPILQRRRKFNEERRLVIRQKTQKLLSVGHKREIQYPEWLANVVLVKTAN